MSCWVNVFADTYFLKLSEGYNQESGNVGEHIKEMFGSSWKEVLCESQLVEGKVDPGNPAVLVISASAIRSLEMLRFEFVLSLY